MGKYKWKFLFVRCCRLGKNELQLHIRDTYVEKSGILMLKNILHFENRCDIVTFNDKTHVIHMCTQTYSKAAIRFKQAAKLLPNVCLTGNERDERYHGKI